MKRLQTFADNRKKLKANRPTKLFPGWSYPNEKQLKAKWENWGKLYENQAKDFDTLVTAHFEESVRKIKEQEEADKLAFESL